MPDTTPQAGRQSAPTQVPTGAARFGPLARLSLDQKLPLIMAALLLAVVATVFFASYREIRATAQRVASERISGLATQFHNLYATSGPTARAGMMALAARPGIVAYAKAPSARTRDAALADLRFVANNPQQVIATELRDGAGEVLLSTAPGAGVDAFAVGDVLPRTEPGDSAVIGTFRMLRDTIVYPIASHVPGGGDQYVVRWRRVVVSEQSLRAVQRILGSFGRPYLGNSGGTTWVDFAKVSPPPPFDFARGQPVQVYERDGTSYLGAGATIAGTPWAVAVDVPMSVVMQPATTFLQRMSVLALVALAIALVSARIVSRRITEPLLQLTEAAAGIAGGDFSRPVKIDRADELGRLGRAFGAMASEVKHTRENLERRVDERTRDLNDTMRQLHDAQGALVRKEKLAMLGQLAGGVGHELRNPLGVMTNSVYYLKMVLESQPKNVHEYLDILQQQITLSEKIVSDLLDFARQKPSQREPISLADVSAQQVSRLGSTQGVRVESEVNGALPAVLVDQVQVGQIIFNLLTNAVQAVEGEGQVYVRAIADGDRVHYDVADTGPGVAVENLEKVFEPLFTTKARGIGLGLAVSRALARNNGGDLTVSNAANGGAVFRLTLPIAGGEGT